MHEDVQSTSSEVVSPIVSISPLELLRPFPKANQKKINRAPNRKRQAAILTSTPVKNRLEREKLAVAQKQLLKTTKKRQPKTSINTDCFCAICQASYSTSVTSWIKCLGKKCHSWVHEDCVDRAEFVCNNCE